MAIKIDKKIPSSENRRLSVFTSSNECWPCACSSPVIAQHELKLIVCIVQADIARNANAVIVMVYSPHSHGILPHSPRFRFFESTALEEASIPINMAVNFTSVSGCIPVNSGLLNTCHSLVTHQMQLRGCLLSERISIRVRVRGRFRVRVSTSLGWCLRKFKHALG